MTQAPEARGISLERAFAEWMKSHLGYTRTRLRVPVKGRIADRAYEVDIHGEKFSATWDRVRILGVVLIILAVLVYALPSELEDVRKLMEETVASSTRPGQDQPS